MVIPRKYHRGGYRGDLEQKQYFDTCDLYVGRLILRPAKLTPQGFSFLDPLVTESREKDRIVLRAKPGRERGYFANGLVALSNGESVCGLAVLTDKAGYTDNWVCVEITYVSERFVKAMIAPSILPEDVEKYYRWVSENAQSSSTYELWASKR